MAIDGDSALENVLNLLQSSIQTGLTEGEKVLKGVLGPAYEPVEGLAQLFTPDVPAIYEAGKELVEKPSPAALTAVGMTAALESPMGKAGKVVSKTSKSNRDYPDTLLNQRLNFKKQIEFLEDHGYSLATDSKNKNFKYNIEDDRIIVYTPLGGTKVKDKYEQKTFKNPTLKQMRNWMGYKKGGSIVERNLYNYTAKAI